MLHLIYSVFFNGTNLLLSEKFEHVTILFSDIVTFTNIAAACTPMNIVTMLNDLYQRFDAMTSVHDVYKGYTFSMDHNVQRV
jgi:class 3 adenylate cyclase